MQINHCCLEYDLPMDSEDIWKLIDRLSKSPGTSANGDSFAVHTLDLGEAISVLEQLAAQL